jgi:TonB family protein
VQVSVPIFAGCAFNLGGKAMAVKSIIQNSYRDPGTAAMISIIPALGQLYNGQTRKGLLFLAVDAVNLVLFSFLIFTTPFIEAINNFGLANHLKPNTGLRYSLLQLHFGSAVSLVLTGCLLMFIALAMCDAYDNAANTHRKGLYPGCVMELPEAASGSYLFHFAVLTVGFILAFFFLVPPPPLRQVTEIQFFPDQPKVEHRVVSVRKSQQNSENAGRATTREATPSPPTTRQVQTAARANPAPARTLPKPVPPQQAPTPRLAVTPLPQALPHPMPQALPHPMPQTNPHPLPQPLPQPAQAASTAPDLRPNPRPNLLANNVAAPTPMIRPAVTANTNAPPLPMAITGSRSSSNPAPMPVSAGHSSNTNSAGPAPAPVAVGSSSSSGTTPHLVPISGQSGRQGSNPNQSPPAPSHSRYSESGASGPVIAMTPSLPRSGQNVLGGPHESDKPKEVPSIATEPIDWGPYMADLQRRIKRAWFPPRGQEDRRVVLTFKVHSNGELSHLRLTGSSGYAEADRQALAAVENAAPFQHLPKGASDDADIQFTFDYNVYSGGKGFR